MLDLPAPLGPTNATVWPALIVSVSPFRTSLPSGYAKLTSSNRSSSRSGPISRASGRSSSAGAWSSAAARSTLADAPATDWLAATPARSAPSS